MLYYMWISFLSAFLLFDMQPVVGRYILPRLPVGKRFPTLITGSAQLSPLSRSSPFEKDYAASFAVDSRQDR